MLMLALIATTLVGVLHVYILVLEMFFWTKPLGMKSFGLKPDFAQATKALAANQGLYNGFLAAGLFWGVAQGVSGLHIQLFFLGCVLVAGVFGALTASRKILFVQAVPAAITIALLMMARLGAGPV